VYPLESEYCNYVLRKFQIVTLNKVFDVSSFGFHSIIRRAFRASIQSERNQLTDRLKRIDDNMKQIESINLTSDRNSLKQIMPDMFKSFDLGINVLDRNLSINEELYGPLEKQKNTLSENLVKIEHDHKTFELEVDDSKTKLMSNLPLLNEAMPPANSKGNLWVIFLLKARQKNRKRMY
jgi:hypothetical protein